MTGTSGTFFRPGDFRRHPFPLRSARCIFLAAAFLCLFAGLFAAARTEAVQAVPAAQNPPTAAPGSVRVELCSEESGSSVLETALNAAGFLPLEVRVENSRPENAPLTLNALIGSAHRHHSGLSTEARISAPPGRSKHFVFLPKPYWGAGSVRVEVHGADFEQSSGRSAKTHHFHSRVWGTAPTQPVLLPKTTPGLTLEEIRAAFGKNEVHTPGLLAKRFSEKTQAIDRKLIGASQDLAELPADSRALTNWSGIWVPASHWNSAPAPLRAVLRDWVRAGGRLFVMGDAAVPAVELPPREQANLGLGNIRRVANLERHGLGAFKEDVLSLDAAPSPLRDVDYQHWTSKNLAPFRTNVPALLGVLLGFAVAIVPLNLLWLAPPRRRHRLILSLPILALGAAGGLVAFILAKEGSGGTGLRNGLLLLSPGEARAPFYQEQLSRTGMISLAGFDLPEDTTFTVCSTTARRMSLSRSGTRAAGSWFENRSTQGHVLQRWIPTPAAVSLQPPPTGVSADAAPVLRSSADFPMGPVFYAAPDGTYWRAESLQPHTQTALLPSERAAFEAWFWTSVEEPSSNLRARMREALERRDWFFASASAAPGVWIDTSPHIRWTRNQLLCVGPVQKEVQP